MVFTFCSSFSILFCMARYSLLGTLPCSSLSQVTPQHFSQNSDKHHDKQHISKRPPKIPPIKQGQTTAWFTGLLNSAFAMSARKIRRKSV